MYSTVYTGRLGDFFPQAVEDRTTASFKFCKYIIECRFTPSSKSEACGPSVNKSYCTNFNQLNVADKFDK